MRIEQSSITQFGTVGFYNKGPVNEAIRIETQEDLTNIFGAPGDLSAQYWFPVATLLDQSNSVWTVRVEESTKRCPGISVGTIESVSINSGLERVVTGQTVNETTSVSLSAGEVAAVVNPQRVELYPLTYGSIAGDPVVSIATDLSGAETSGANGGFMDPDEMSGAINVFAVGPGEDYHFVSFAICNRDDYLLLQDYQTELSETFTEGRISVLCFYCRDLTEHGRLGAIAAIRYF